MPAMVNWTIQQTYHIHNARRRKAGMLRMIWNKISAYKRNKWMGKLVRRGLKIGKNVQFDGDCFIDPDHCFLISIGDNCIFADGVTLLAHDGATFPYIGISKIGRITIKENCAIAHSTIVFPGITIGPNSIVGAYSVVAKDIPPNSVAVGNPAKVICSLETYLKKHEENSKKYRLFHEKEYNIQIISEEKKIEMLDYLEKNRIAYMTGNISDIFKE